MLGRRFGLPFGAERARCDGPHVILGLTVATDAIQIPDRALFKAAEVCEIAQVQPYVLRSWETEFPDLGTTRTAGGQRVYRQADVKRVLRIKCLLFVEGLTLGAARRKLEDEIASTAGEGEASGDSLNVLFAQDARERLAEVKKSLRSILDMLSANGGGDLDRNVDGVTVAVSKRAARAKPLSRTRRPERGRRTPMKHKPRRT